MLVNLASRGVSAAIFALAETYDPNVLAAWGVTDGIDGTSGEQPRGTVVDGLFCHELGQYEKQSSCWFQAKTALTEIKNSIMFNGLFSKLQPPSSKPPCGNLTLRRPRPQAPAP